MPNFIHHQLVVFDKTVSLIRDIDPIFAAWPRERGYLRWQGRDSFSSIGLNIGEAAHDYHRGDQARLFNYARRSAGESVANLDIALALRLNTESELAPFYDRCNEVIAMLTPLAKPMTKRPTLESWQPRGKPPAP